MADWESGGALGEAFSTLRVHDAPVETVERIRVRCRAELVGRQRADASAPPPTWRTWLEPVLALGLGALYLAEAVGRALEVYR